MRVDTAHAHVAARHDGGEGPRGADDPVADDAVLGRLEARHAVHGQRRAARAARCSRPSGCSIGHRSTISGSRAALSMTVRAVGEHGRHQDVLGGADAREVEPDLRAVQAARPRRRRSRARSRSSRRACSRPALVHVQRPRSRSRRHRAARTTARRHRPTSGPSTQIDARSLPIASESALVPSSAGDVDARHASPSTVDRAAQARSTSAISGTSRMSGQLVIVVVPSASSAAAISLRTLFFAPTTSTRRPAVRRLYPEMLHHGRRR